MIINKLIHIQYGIKLDGKLYGFKNKKLYSLPKFKELKMQLSNTSKGYYLNRTFYSLKRLKDLVIEINYNIKVFDYELPF